MSSIKKRNYQWILPLIITFYTVLICFLSCSGFKSNPVEAMAADIDLVNNEGIKVDTLSGFAGEVVNIGISVLSPGDLDSVSYKTSSGVNGGISSGKLTDFQEISLSFDRPCIAALTADGFRNGKVITSDSVIVLITEKPGKNNPPVISLNPIRCYASPALPCSLKLSVTNKESWQKVALSSNVKGTFFSDTLFIWTPLKSDTGTDVRISITAEDDGVPPESVTVMHSVFVIADGGLCAQPQNLRITEKTAKFIKIAWDGDSQADGYILYRSKSGEDGTWKEIKVAGTAYADSTEDVYFYRVAAVNYFGVSAPSEVIRGGDSLYFDRRVFFTDSISTAYESDTIHEIRLQVTTRAADDIKVWYSPKGLTADTGDFKAISQYAEIPAGDTAGVLSIKIVNDTINEGTEKFSVFIDSVSNGFVCGKNVHTVSIIDNDTLFAVLYDGNGADVGTAPVDNNRYVQGATVTVIRNKGNLVRTGFTFSGWNTRSDGRGEEYEPGDTFALDTLGVTLYASWTPNQYTVTFHGNGNDSGTVPGPETHYYGDSVKVPGAGDLRRTGYTLSGWEDDSSGVVYKKDTAFIMGVSDVSLHAVWKLAPAVIISQPSDVSVRAGNKVTFVIKVSESNLKFQWQRDGKSIEGAVKDTLTIPMATRSDGGSTYRCIVSNSAGSVESSEALLNVISIAAVSAGDEHTMILMTDGTLWATGNNEYGQLGDSTLIERQFPVKIMSDVSSISAGEYHTMIIKKDGTLWAAGFNYSGQLGDGTQTDRLVPVRVMSGGVSSVSAGGLHTMIKTDGTLWATGDNSNGQLGDSTIENTNSPVLVMSGVSAVSAGSYHTMIIKDDGTLWCTGYNPDGRLGDGTTDSKNEPIEVTDSLLFVSAGAYHTMIIKDDGTLWGTGDNYYGQLGDGTNTDRYTFVKITQNVLSASAGASHTMIIKNDGTLWGTGDNYSGQLGDGTNTDKNTFVEITQGVQSVSTGTHYTMILKRDGTLWGTGENYYGQLGDGTTVDKNKPVLIIF